MNQTYGKEFKFCEETAKAAIKMLNERERKYNCLVMWYRIQIDTIYVTGRYLNSSDFWKQGDSYA
jgi:hypothetical protein